MRMEQARALNGRRSAAHTYRWVHGMQDMHLVSGLRREDGQVITGPEFASLDTTMEWISHHGGGDLIMDRGKAPVAISDRGCEGQIPLLRWFHGSSLGWRDYVWSEAHPRA